MGVLHCGVCHRILCDCALEVAELRKENARLGAFDKALRDEIEFLRESRDRWRSAAERLALDADGLDKIKDICAGGATRPDQIKAIFSEAE